MIRSFATETDSGLIPAMVISTDDPEGRGRVKVQRLDQSNLKEDDLPWIYIHGQSHVSNVWGKGGQSIGQSTHALIAGTWLNVSKRHSDGQTGASHGVVTTTEGEQGSGQT
jgi:hypothetical protein